MVDYLFIHRLPSLGSLIGSFEHHFARLPADTFSHPDVFGGTDFNAAAANFLRDRALYNCNCYCFSGA